MIYNVDVINNLLLPLITSILSLLISYYLKKIFDTAYGEIHVNTIKLIIR